MSNIIGTAVRTWNKAHTKATITIVVDTDDEHVHRTAGGNRAARANAVVVTRYDYPSSTEPRYVIELRADRDAAVQLAAAHRRDVIKSRYSEIRVTPCTWSIVLDVEESI